MSQSPFEALVRDWWAVFKRTFRGYQDEGHSDWAAALTFYAALLTFPVLLAVVAFVGLIGGPVVRPLMDNFDASAPGGPVSDLAFISLNNLLSSRGQAFVLLLVGVSVALWAAIGYIATFRRATNRILHTAEDRPPTKTLSARFGIPLLFAWMMAFSVVIVLFTGGLATRIGQMLGVGRAGTVVWNILKWPALVVLVAAMLVILFRTAPTIRRPNYRGVTPGITVAVVLWLVVSLLFGLYLAGFGAYNQTYASLAAAIIFLVWFWAANNAILLGVKFDADLRYAKGASGGRPGEAKATSYAKGASAAKSGANEGTSAEENSGSQNNATVDADGKATARVEAPPGSRSRKPS